MATKLKASRNGILLEPRPGGQWYLYQYHQDRLDWIFSFDSGDKAVQLFNLSKPHN